MGGSTVRALALTGYISIPFGSGFRADSS